MPPVKIAPSGSRQSLPVESSETQPPRQAVAGEAYVTKKGDTLWRMAEQAYGDGTKWPLIHDANKDKVKLTDPQTAIIGTGVRFQIPVAPERERVTGGWSARERATGPQPQKREPPTQPHAKAEPAHAEPAHAEPHPPEPVKVDTKKASDDATSLYNAMKGGLFGAGSDEDAIFKTLEGRSPEHLAAVKTAYQDHYHRDLDFDLKDELSGKDLTRAQSLMKGDAGAASAVAIKQAIGTVYNDNDAVYRALENKTPQQLQQVKDSYQRQFGVPLERALEQGMSGDKLARAKALLGGNPVAAEAAELSQALRGAGTDEATVMKVLANKTPAQIDALRGEFKKQGRNMDLEIENELSGAELKQAKALLGGTGVERERKTGGAAPASGKTETNRARADAAIIEGALGTLSNDYGAIERALGGKSPAQIAAINDAFQASTGKSLESAFRSGMSGAKLSHAMELIRGEGMAPAAQLRKAVEGAGTDEELIKTQLQGMSKQQIAEVKADYRARYGEDLGTRLESELSGRDLFDVKNMLNGVPESPSEALSLLNTRHQYERGGWKNALAGGAIDLVSDSGKLLDTTVERANAYQRTALAENKAAGLPEKLTPQQEQRLGELIGYGVGDVGGYREARDTAGEVAANVATTAAAVGVTVATGGIAAPIAAAGVARVVAKGVFAGESYTVGAAATDAVIGGVEGGLNAATLGSASAMTAAKTAGNAAARGVANTAGRVVSERAAVAIGQTAGRVVAGATEGAITGGIAGAASGAVHTAVDDKTWDNGVVAGLGNVAGGAVAGGTTGVAVGSVVGGAMNARGGHVKIDEPQLRSAQARQQVDELLGVRPGPTDAAHAAKQAELDDVFKSRTPAQARAEIDEQLGVRAKPTHAQHASRQSELDDVFQSRTPAQARAEIDQQLGVRTRPTAAQHAAKKAELEQAFSARHGKELTTALNQEAKAAGYRAPEVYAMEHLQHPNEIAEFAQGYAKKHPGVAVENMKYALQRGGHVDIAPGTDAAWRQAISDAEKATARSGRGLNSALTKEAQKAGYKASDLYAVEHLRNPHEIAEFAEGYVKKHGTTAVENMKYALGDGSISVAPGTRDAWRAAIAKAEGTLPGHAVQSVANQGDDALRAVEKLRGASGRFKPENPGELDTMRRAVDQLRGASGRLKPENPAEAKLARDLLKYFGASNNADDVAGIVKGLHGPNGFNPGSRAEMGFMRSAYEKLKTAADPRNSLVGKQLGEYFAGRTTLLNEVGKLRDAAGRLLPFDQLKAPDLSKMREAMDHLFTFGHSNPAEKALETELVQHVARHGSHVDMVHVSLMLLGHPQHGAEHGGAEHGVEHTADHGAEAAELGIDHEALLGKTLQTLEREGPQNADEVALLVELRERYRS